MLRFVVSAFVLVIAFSIHSVAAADLRATAQQIRGAMEARDFDRAEQLVRDLRATDATAFTANHYDYLLARLCERKGAQAEATALYLNILNRNSLLAQYALHRLAGLARAAGDLALERQYLSRLLAAYPSSALIVSARDRLLESYRESSDYQSTISSLRPIASAVGVRGRSAMARLGEAYAKTGDTSSARPLFNQLIAGSRDDYALQGAQGLDELDQQAKSQPDEFEALRRARIYLTNRHWAQARTHLLDIVERFPQSQNRAEALYQTGFTYYREDNFDEALKWFARAHAEFPTKKEGEQGYYWVATALQKAQRYEDAARRYIEFISAYPQSEAVEGAYRNTVDCFRYAGKYPEALEWSRRIGTLYAGKPLAVVGLFNEAKIELVHGNFEQAAQLFLRLQAQPLYPRLISAPIRGEAAFMRMYAIEQMGRISEAARLYLTIPDERDNYFGHRATMRLQALAKTKEGRAIIESLARSYQQQARAALAAGRFSEAKDAAHQALRLVDDEKAQRDLISLLRVSYGRLPAYATVWRYRLAPVGREVVTDGKAVSLPSNHNLAAELLFLGLYDEGTRELRLAGASALGSTSKAMSESEEEEIGALQAPLSGSDVSYSMAVYSHRGDQANYAIDFAEGLFKSIPQDYRLDLLPRDLIELLYPAPYRDALLQYAQAYGVDERLVLALARQESRFNPTVKSAAAARGLMQFIADTALPLAREEGLTDFELDDLYKPHTAIRFASRYVADLFKLFPSNSYAVIASYNTDEANVERWIFRAKSNDVDRLVVEIALPETKDYVAKVVNNYRAYQQLYNEDLKRK